MVDTQIRPADVTKFPIIDAMLQVRREVFVPDHLRETAYADAILDVGHGRMILEPRTFAKMLDAVDIQGNELVLDLGCGLVQIVIYRFIFNRRYDFCDFTMIRY